MRLDGGLRGSATAAGRWDAGTPGGEIIVTNGLSVRRERGGRVLVSPLRKGHQPLFVFLLRAA